MHRTLGFVANGSTALALCLAAAASPAALAQCIDRDADGFFPIAGCGTAKDCNDQSADIRPGAVELCNGFDDNCNGLADEAPACDGVCDAAEQAGEPTRVTFTAGGSTRARVAWTGQGYGAVWQEESNGGCEIYFARLDAEGLPLGDPVRVTDHPALSVSPTLVWTGAEFGVVWADDRDGNFELYFARLSSSGARIGGDIRVTNSAGDAHEPALVWMGFQYGLAWVDDRSGDREIYYARLSGDGGRIGADIQVTSSAGEGRTPALAWTGVENGLSWSDSRDGAPHIYFTRLSMIGVRQTEDILVSDADLSHAESPSLVWTGTEWGVAWCDLREGLYDSFIFFARLRNDGAKIAADALVSDAGGAYSPSLQWSGEEFAVAWESASLYFRRVGPDGIPLPDETVVSGSGSAPSLVWNGGHFGAVFAEWVGGVEEIIFTRVGCNCVDNDGDAVTNCNDCDDASGAAWSRPGEVLELQLNPDTQRVTWIAPLELGSAPNLVRYDTLRSNMASDFGVSALCLESNGVDRQSRDSDDPDPGSAFFYLVRAENSCPAGQGSLGTNSIGVERSGRNCP